MYKVRTITQEKVLNIYVAPFVLFALLNFFQENQASAILPAHLLLKSENSKIVDPSSRSFSDRPKRRQQRIKPSDDLDLPILPFHYSTSRDKLPLESDLDPQTLSLALGSNFDPEFMSINRPLESIRHPNGTYFYDPKIFGRTKYKGDLAAGKTRNDLSLLQRDEVNFQLNPFTLPGLRGAKFFIQNKKRRLQFEKYLAALTYCPVRFKWKDLGPRFWPRWIKEGNCKDADSGSQGKKKGSKKKDNSIRRSCSIPAGMTCAPKKSTTMTLLWWHCKHASQKNSQSSQCLWINIKYPIITQCTCSCK